MSQQFVVDNSVVMTWCFEDERNAYADTVLDKLTDGIAYVPGIWSLEVANVLLVAERKKRISTAASTRFVNLLLQLPLLIAPETFGRATSEIMAIGRAHQLSSYDAAYLDLAMKRGIPLATLDKRLQAAATDCELPILR